MSYLEASTDEASSAAQFGFAVERTRRGWRWVAYDALGRVAEAGEEKTRAEAAAMVIRALSRT